MNEQVLWEVILGLLVVEVATLASLWFVLPRAWIAWSRLAGEKMPLGPPPWKSLNWFGKALFVLAGGVGLMMLGTILIGAAIEHDYL